MILGLLPLQMLRAGDAPATQPLTEDQQMQSWWEDLAKPDPAASRALLKFADKPEQAVAFLKEHLKPLTISEEDVNKLIEDLSSDDESVWKPAFEKLEYFDPRLALDLQHLMATVTEPAARTRLVEILSNREADSLQGKNINIRNVGDGFNFYADNGSWWAEDKVERLGIAGFASGKPGWTRATRAIILLEHIGSPDAIAILKDMATGHADASPTKAAIEALHILKVN
jgi:hypothetical protein